jgi:hypothetical protein
MNVPACASVTTTYWSGKTLPPPTVTKEVGPLAALEPPADAAPDDGALESDDTSPEVPEPAGPCGP